MIKIIYVFAWISGATGPSYDDDVACITLADIITQRDYVSDCISGLIEDTPTRLSLNLMLVVVDELLALYKRVGPLSDIWRFPCQRRSDSVMGSDRWEAVKVAIKEHDVKGALFDIPLDHTPGQSLILKDFKLEDTVPYVNVYDQVPLYFAKHIYA